MSMTREQAEKWLRSLISGQGSSALCPASPAKEEAGRLDGTLYKRCPLCHKSTSAAPTEQPAPSDRQILAAAEYGWRQALAAMAEMLDHHVKAAARQGVRPADARLNLTDLLLIVKRHGENPPIGFVAGAVRLGVGEKP